MTGLAIWLCVVAAFLATCVLNPWIASRKNRSAALWFVLGLLFNPIAFFILLFKPALPPPAD